MHSVPGSPGPSGYRAGTPTPPAVRDRRLGSAGRFIQPSGNTSKYLRPLPTASPKDKASGGTPHCRAKKRILSEGVLKKKKKKLTKIMLKILKSFPAPETTREQCQGITRTQAGKEKPSSLRLKVTGKPNVSRGKKRLLQKRNHVESSHL